MARRTSSKPTVEATETVPTTPEQYDAAASLSASLINQVRVTIKAGADHAAPWIIVNCMDINRVIPAIDATITALTSRFPATTRSGTPGEVTPAPGVATTGT
ncbi:MAG: hypothetical protein GEV28_16895 [Actinophytocola sp.]|uniref:hypothetical protein n=1 Tax=Actinophytocola sp. TaxID=1872138 RepID=UPI00132B1B32|nr:hypothetical protein [Actinophytocola sp.]MPZ81971.1 hypothetical protein [Actinophytocola sp.]